MPSYTTADIRNVLLVGHGGCGKTSLSDALLAVAEDRDPLAAVELDLLEDLERRRQRLDEDSRVVVHRLRQGVQVDGREADEIRGGQSKTATSPVPSTSYSGERDRVRGVSRAVRGVLP